MQEPNQRYKRICQASTTYMGWALMIYAGTVFAYVLFPLFVSPEKILPVSSIITAISLFILGFSTVHEKEWSFVGWTAFTLAVGILIFTIPGGINLVYLFIIGGLTTIASYDSFTKPRKAFSSVSARAGVLFLIIFISHSLILSFPQKFGLKTQGGKLWTMASVSTKSVEINPFPPYNSLIEKNNPYLYIFNIYVYPLAHFARERLDAK